jgi:hypothetical protein
MRQSRAKETRIARVTTEEQCASKTGCVFRVLKKPRGLQENVKFCSFKDGFGTAPNKTYEPTGSHKTHGNPNKTYEPTGSHKTHGNPKKAR